MTLPTSLFVSAQVQGREVTLADGTTHVLFFKELPAVTFKTYSRLQASTDQQDQDTCMARLIAESLCDEEGKRAMTFEQACQLRLDAATAIFQAVLDVNGLSGKKGDRSPGASASGTS